MKHRLGLPVVTARLFMVYGPGQRDLGDIHLMFGDQAQQQVEGAAEIVQPYFETGTALGPRCRQRLRRRSRVSHQGAPPRAISSLASWR